MSPFRTVARGLDRFFHRQAADRELDDEVQHYVEMATKAHMREGMTQGTAQRIARAEFGGVEAVKEQIRTGGWEAKVESFARTIRYAFRGLWRSPAYTAAVTFTLVLGIGANVLVFSVADAVLLRPLPYPDPGSLYNISTDHVGPDGKSIQYFLGDLEFLRWRAHTKTLEQLEAILPQDAALTGNGDPETVASGQTSAGLFAMLGARPQLGRLFAAADDVPHSGVTIISHEFWVSHFASDPSVLGRSITIDGEPRAIVGVMPPRFLPLLQKADLWIPLEVTEANQPHGGTSRFLFAVGRLRHGAAPAELKAELHALGEDLVREAPATRTGWTGGMQPLRETLVGDQTGTIVAFVVLVSFLLLLACVNVANLTLARVTTRRAETALRIALGGGRRRVIEGLLTETMLLASVGGLLGIGVAMVAIHPIAAAKADQIPLLAYAHIDLRVILFAIGITIFAGFACTAIPVAQVLRSVSTSALLSGGSRTTTGAADRHTRRALMTVQVALALVLLAGAGSMIRVVTALTHVAPGYTADGVEAVELTLPASRYPDQASRALFVDQVLRHARAIPGVTSASATVNRFQLGTSRQTAVFLEGRPVEPGNEILTHFRRIGADYFETMKIPLRSGRPLSDIDRADAVPVAVVNRSFVERYLHGLNPIGTRIKRTVPDAPWTTIVGVAENVRDAGLSDSLGPMVYLPFAQVNVASVTLVVRSTLTEQSITRTLRSALHEVDPLESIDHLGPLTGYLADSLATQRFRALLLSAFAALGLLLAVIGVYGVTAYLLSERRREVAIRLALGGQPVTVVRLLAVESAQWIGAGAIIGGLIATALATVAKSRVADIVTIDLATTAGIAVLMVIIAMVATVLPMIPMVRMRLVGVLRGE